MALTKYKNEYPKFMKAYESAVREWLELNQVGERIINIVEAVKVFL